VGWRGLLWWLALVANACLALLLAASAGALLWAEPEERGDAMIVLALVPAPALAVAALLVGRRSPDARMLPSVFD
jgi:hypothetical protein